MVNVLDLKIEVADSFDLLPEIGILLQNPKDKYARIDTFVHAHIDFFEIRVFP